MNKLEFIEVVKITSPEEDEQLIECINDHECLSYNDQEHTIFAHPGPRFFLAAVSWFILGHSIETGHGFFASLILFVSPLLLDYLSFKPGEKKREFLRKLEIFLGSSWVFIGFLGLVKILLVESINQVLFIKVSKDFIVLKGATFPLQFLWYFVGLTVLTTIVDWFAYREKVDDATMEKIELEQSG